MDKFFSGTLWSRAVKYKIKRFSLYFIIQYQNKQDFNLILLLYNNTEWNSGAKSYSVHDVFLPMTID